MPNEKPFSDPGGPKFKIVEKPEPTTDRGLTEEGARAWLGLPVPAGRAPVRRTISPEEEVSNA